MTIRQQGHYYAIWTPDGYVGRYRSHEDAAYARRRLYGIRATAHQIIKVSAKWGANDSFDDPNGKGA
jgi:hypothetical protein